MTARSHRERVRLKAGVIPPGRSARLSNWLSLFELWPTRIDGPAFLTTFNFDPAFFELRLLPELLRRGASPVVVLLDRDEGLGPAVDMLAAALLKDALDAVWAVHGEAMAERIADLPRHRWADVLPDEDVEEDEIPF